MQIDCHDWRHVQYVTAVGEEFKVEEGVAAPVRLVHLSGDHVLAGGTSEKAGRSDHTSWAELPHRGESTVVTSDEPGLALKDDEDPGRDVVGIRQLTPEIKTEHAASTAAADPEGTVERLLWQSGGKITA